MDNLELPVFRPAKRERRELQNVNLPPSLWRELTIRADEADMSRNDFIEQALRFALDHIAKSGDLP